MKKKLLCALLVLAITISTLCIIPIGADAANPNTIIMRLNSTSAFLNHKKIVVDPSNPDVSPFTLNSKTMVPVRFVQQLGADVKYTSVNEPVTVTYGEIALSLSFGKSEMHKVVAGEHAGIIDLPTPPTLVEGKTCVPIREIAEGLGFSVNYNSGNFVIVVSTSTITASQLDAEIKYGADNLPTTVSGVKSITAKNNARSIAVGGSVQLSAADITFDPAQVGCQLLLYSTSNPEVATVTSNGKIIGVADGRANITVSSHNGRTAVIEVTVGTGVQAAQAFAVPNDSDFKLLMQQLQDVYIFPWNHTKFNYEAATAEDVISSFLEGGWGSIYSYYFGRENISVSNDPLNKVGGDYIYRFSTSKIDWILENIFNIEPNHNISLRGFYCYNGNYYYGSGEGGEISHVVTLQEKTQLEDGKYNIICNYDYEETNLGTDSYKITAGLKEINGKKYWSFYKIDSIN